MKKIIGILIVLPNLPFIIAFGIYLIIKICLYTSWTELKLRETLMTPEIKEYSKKCYPKELHYFIAFIVYSLITMNIIF